MIKIHLARVLAERNLKQRQFAEIAGIRPNAINNLCNANNPAVKSNLQRIDIDILDRICEALDIQPGDLLEYVSKANDTAIDDSLDSAGIPTKEEAHQLTDAIQRDRAERYYKNKD